MNARERVARQHGDCGIFLSTKEIGLIMGLLSWVSSQMTTAADQYRQLPDEYLAMLSAFPQDLLTVMLPVLDGTKETLLTQAIADCDENSDESRRSLLQSDIELFMNNLEQIQMAYQLTAQASISSRIVNG